MSLKTFKGISVYLIHCILGNVNDFNIFKWTKYPLLQCIYPVFRQIQSVDWTVLQAFKRAVVWIREIVKWKSFTHVPWQSEMGDLSTLDGSKKLLWFTHAEPIVGQVKCLKGHSSERVPTFLPVKAFINHVPKADRVQIQDLEVLPLETNQIRLTYFVNFVQLEIEIFQMSHVWKKHCRLESLYLVTKEVESL